MKIIVNQFRKPLYEISILNEDLLNGGEIFIGREDDCHVQLESFQVSRHHATISILNDQVELNVLSEYGGVRVNGNEINSVSLYENVKIEIAEFQIILSHLPEQLVERETARHSDYDEVVPPSESLSIIPDAQEKTDTFDEEILKEDMTSDPYSESSDEEPIVNVSNSEVESELESDSEIEAIADVDELDDNQNDGNEDKDFNNDFSDNNDEVQSNDGFDDFSEKNDDFSEDNDGFGDDSSKDEATQVFQSFAKYDLKLFGEHAPFDRFRIEENEVLIGRDLDKCHIVLDDAEVSKIHAKIKKTLVNCTIEDLDSSNGILFNGERVNTAELSNNDEFIIGETTFTVVITSDIIEAEKGMLMPIEDNQEVEIEEVVEEEVDFEGFEGEGEIEEDEEKSLIKKILKDPKKRLMAVVGVVLLVVLMIDTDSETTEKSQGEIEAEANKNKKTKIADEKRKKYSPEVLEKLEQNYQLALAKFNDGDLYEAKEYLDIVTSVDLQYKDSASLKKLIEEGLDALVRMKGKEQEAKERKARQVKINALLEKAKEAVKKREVESAKNYFNLIFDLDPENIDVPPLKFEITAYVDEQRRLKDEAQILKAKRQSKVDLLSPGKTLYLKGEWYKAVDRLDSFLKIKDMDEDLIRDATTMLKTSQQKLLAMINPLVSKARSFKEGQDLKQAFETYGEVLSFDPSNEEALNERDQIFQDLKNRSRKIYRDALVAESLSLYGKAKEKFQEVQQVSPLNSEYYIKASDKLKNYLD